MGCTVIEVGKGEVGIDSEVVDDDGRNSGALTANTEIYIY